jgi:hypothetical protein
MHNVTVISFQASNIAQQRIFFPHCFGKEKKQVEATPPPGPWFWREKDQQSFFNFSP